MKTFSEKIKKEKFSFCCNYSELEGKLVAPVRFFLRKDISFTDGVQFGKFLWTLFSRETNGGLTLCMNA